jgi:aspartyl-tRNA(Asn)/glutamyl-tRNA(Gln) amidotransferase subunit A
MPLTLPPDYESYFDQWEKKIGAFIEFDPLRFSPEAGSSGSGARGPSGSSLSGLPFAVKDNIAVKGFSLSCGSKLLEHLRAPYTATAVEKLLAAGAAPVGKTNLDEFGMGSSTDNSGIKRTNNPWDIERVPGGSSGGSAAAVAAGLVPLALGADPGGSVGSPPPSAGWWG